MSEIKYTKTHEWIRQDDGDYLIGITDHAQKLLGDLVFVELPEPGDEVQAGDELGVVESVKAASDFYAPVSGVVVGVNQDVCENPALVNTDPYGSGWLVRMRVAHRDELASLLNDNEYELEIAEDH